FRTVQDGQVANVSVWHFSKRYSEGDTLPSSVNWNKAEDDSDLANDMLDALFAYLQDEKSSFRSSSFLPKTLAASPRSNLTADGNGFPVLMLEQDFNHAWYQVGEALQKAKIKVDDLNRSLGIYYLRVKNPSDDDKLMDVQLKLVQSETGVQVNVQKDDEAFAPIEVCNMVLSTIKSNLTY
ncbi:MAG TPA: outer membrane protein assembly factor BamC, partial [Pseudomonadales bacterium]|nr:outer membrane protein assembly factor BamC [Pseudomonadales bacterium]